MAKRSRSKLRAPLVRGALRLFAALPLPLNHAAGTLAGLLAWHLPTRARRVTLRNLERCCPELPPNAQRRLARRSLMETGRTAAETGPLWFWPERRIRPLVRQVCGKHHLDEALGKGKGVILAIPHLGSWEMVGLYCSLHFPITALYRPPRERGLEQTMRRGRERFGARLVPTDARGVRALYDTLRQGEVICILPDQVPSAGQGVFAPFFGIPAKTMTLLPRLAGRFGSEVLFCYAERLPRGEGFRIHFRPAPTGIGDADSATAAAALNQGVEECVRALPEQYQWSYKRFRRQPPGTPAFYR